MTKLTGSEKQIAWAETIRSDFSRSLEALKGKITDSDKSDPRMVRAQEIVTELENEIDQVEESRWWIDNRQTSAALIIKEKF